MTIFLATNTVAGFDFAQDVITTTSAAERDTTNGTPSAMQVKRNVGYLQRELSTPLNEGWFHAGVYFKVPIDVAVRQMLRFYDSAGQILFGITRHGNNMYSNIYTAPTTSVNGPTGTLGGDLFTTLDVNWKIHDTLGFIKIYAGKILISAYTGDTSHFANGGVSAFRIAEFNPYADGTFSEIIIADQDTRGMKVKTMFGNAAGANSGFTGGYADVSGFVGPQETTAITSDTAGQISTFGLADPLASSAAILGVFINARGTKGASGPQGVNGVLRTGGVNYHSVDKAFEGILKSRSFSWDVNPATGLNWTTAELTALEAGVRSRP
ncbi:hypothetical protein LOKG_00041 [Loktanella phage pCB2051-A]|uniref:Uncharacterized protein n=1 Tax=Loktanella phage pCB2051-A TaxID=754044 RepID=M4R178_9CAUD|nr:hypothetical protein LOKG_00041 [Loktanella phage pCB2051-A]AGH31477.1 hypothetical protein LOKG_00041 [Loktanella phage pCB2051-A]